MLRISDDDGSRAEAVARGYMNVKRFSWDKAVRQLEQIYKSLVVAQPSQQQAKGRC